MVNVVDAVGVVGAVSRTEPWRVTLWPNKNAGHCHSSAAPRNRLPYWATSLFKMSVIGQWLPTRFPPASTTNATAVYQKVSCDIAHLTNTRELPQAI